MNQKLVVPFQTLLVLVMAVITSCSVQKENKVLIIGIDGCRPDALVSANAVNIDSLWNNGAYSFTTKTDEISVSGTCWTSMLTGVWHQKHDVISNDYVDPNIDEYPHFFKRVKEYDPTLKTYSIAHWSPLHKILQKGDADVVKNYKSDEVVTYEVEQDLAKTDVDVMFVHLDDVDHAGHTYGYGPAIKEYLDAIQIVDEQVGRIVASLKKRENYNKENWLILLSTDHGGSGKSHGMNTFEHTTIFYIASGSAVKPGKIEKKVFVTDVAASALYHLGVPYNEAWNMDGKPKGLLMD